jgi:hypothetical protein
MYHDVMQRTTVMADPETLAQLREIARREGRSLADVIREALEDRVRRPAPPLHFLGVGASGPDSGPTARESADLRAEPPPWR